MTLINYDRALELLRGAVEEKGEDYRVGTCAIGALDKNGVYAPLCIVGYALNSLDPEAFKKNRPEGFVIKPTWKVGHELTAKAQALWQFAQQKQDASDFDTSDGTEHYQWGPAVEWAVEQVNANGPFDDTVSYGGDIFDEADEV